jgi:hypothetical protein
MIGILSTHSLDEAARLVDGMVPRPGATADPRSRSQASVRDDPRGVIRDRWPSRPSVAGGNSTPFGSNQTPRVASSHAGRLPSTPGSTPRSQAVVTPSHVPVSSSVRVNFISLESTVVLGLWT